jgi:hypothetical protein
MFKDNLAGSKVNLASSKAQHPGGLAGGSNLPELSPQVQPVELKRVVFEPSKFRMETQILKVILEISWYDRAVSERLSFSFSFSLSQRDEDRTWNQQGGGVKAATCKVQGVRQKVEGRR